MRQNNAIRVVSFAWLAVGSVFVHGAAYAQSPRFDPADPFAAIVSAEEWVDGLSTGTPDLDPDDYYRNLTSGEWTQNSWYGQAISAAVEGVTAEDYLQSLSGSGGTGVTIRSPYPYHSAEQHYRAWLEAAGGGRKHTRTSLPDWSGDWQGTATGVLRGQALVRDVMAAVSEPYRPRFEQLLTAELRGRHWWPGATCLPDGFGRYYVIGGTWHFMMDLKLVLIDKDRPNSETRYVYTDGRGFLPNDYQFPQWYGGSQGFWDDDELVIWTTQIKRWVITHALPEYSDRLEAIERWKRIGDEILVDITLYDPEAFAYPWHDTAVFRKLEDWTLAPPTFYECVFTNNTYFDANGEIRQYSPGDPQYRDASDPRPWATVFERAEP